MTDKHFLADAGEWLLEKYGLDRMERIKKLHEECCELGISVALDAPADIAAEIGDVQLVLASIAALYGLDPIKCAREKFTEVKEK